MNHKAQCQCGQLKIDSSDEPDHVVICHCQARQHRTGATFGTGLYFRKELLTTTGRHSEWARGSDSVRGLVNHFCPDCGTTVFWTLEMRPDHMGVALGCLTTPAPTPERAIWTEEAQDWVLFPEDMPVFEKGTPET